MQDKLDLNQVWIKSTTHFWVLIFVLLPVANLLPVELCATTFSFSKKTNRAHVLITFYSLHTELGVFYLVYHYKLLGSILAMHRELTFKVTSDLHGCPRGKKLYARHFKGKHGKLYIVGKLNKFKFWKKNINCWFLQFHKRKSQTSTKMTMCHSIEWIGYQIQVHWQITAQC